MAITDQEDLHFQLVTDDPFDVERLQNICKQTFTETFGADNTDDYLEKFFAEAYAPDVLKAELNADASQTYFYNLNGQIAGYLKVNWSNDQTEPFYPDAFEIQRIYVLKRFQHLHIGGRLMKKALSIAKDLDKSQVWLGVWEQNINAQGFYQHYGFRQVSQHTFSVGNDDQTDYILVKDL